ncbi:MAG: hypothetical protein IT238_03570 [Bacteroidia bacterium]|nr:hypothetical protein [Bacteroidia bacterium]MCZ2247841.1 hypothetical protein [Bacteroidia bacterium]
MKNKLLFVPLLLILASCQPILMKLYGIKNPDIENDKSIIKKALKYGLDTSNIVTVNSKEFLYVITEQGIPNGAIYDRNGNYIEYRQTDTSCNAGLFQFIPALNLVDKYNQPDSSNLKTELSKFRDLKGNTLKQPEPADYYLLIYWTVWAGKLNRDHVKIWEKLARDNKNCKVKVIKVNLDIQEYWNEQERDKIVRAISKKK